MPLVRKGNPSARTRERLERVGAALDNVRSTCDVAARLELDPVAVVHRYAALEDRELVGLIASAVAFGNVKALRAKLEDALQRLGPHIAATADDPDDVGTRLRGWKHRIYRGEDLARLLVGARRVQREAGSLGRRFAADWEREGDLRAALTSFTRAIREAGGLASARRTKRRGSAHILADPAGASGCKRLLLYLRWMVRSADGVDLGLWDVPTSALLVPVDVHIHKLGQNLGFTRRKTTSWKTTEEITQALRRFDPADPVKYDFALCHLGMLRRCPSRRDPVRCHGCGVQAVCRHWENAKAAGPPT
ncbi:MAG TPA: TIGR02757 family protein [Polyangiaceae bacterium]|nr:TIGR02757 family protein [Polyangiaceae bacterium]